MLCQSIIGLIFVLSHSILFDKTFFVCPDVKIANKINEKIINNLRVLFKAMIAFVIIFILQILKYYFAKLMMRS